MRIKKILFVLLFAFLAVPAYSEIALNIIIANPSDSASETIPVKYDLPSRIQKDDILDSAGMEIDYDETEGNYYLQGEFTLTPNETKRLRVRLRDIWSIPEEQIENLGKMLDNRIASIEDNQKSDIAQLVGDDLQDKLDNILEQQAAAEGDIEEKMKLYSVNREKLRQIKDKIFSLDSLVSAYQEGREEELGIVTLVIEAHNSLDKQVDMPVKYYLPKGVIPEHVVDQGDFAIEYDLNQSKFYLYKEENFQPEETKRFTVQIRNIWHVKEVVINQYLNTADKLNERLAETEAAETAQQLVDRIKENAAAITSSQEAVSTVKDRIAVYQLNKKRLAVMKDNLDKLKSLATEFTKVELSAQAEAVQNVMRKIETFSNVEISKLAKDLAEKLKQIGVWKIVYTIILFVIGLTVFFYGLWFFRLKKEDKRRFEKK
jgi:hypothetical protein